LPFEEFAVSNPLEKTDKSTLITQQVMQRIGHDHLKPTPEVYTLLYNYFAGVNPDINRTIDELTHTGQTLTTSLCEDLYDRYLSPKREKAFIDETAKKVQAAMAEITDLIRGAGVVHKEYNANLQRQSDSLSSATDLNEIKKLVTDLVSDTRNIIDENHKLEDKLQTSSHEIQQMRQDMQSLKHEALTDTLTGMANRKSFDIELKNRASEALDKNKPLSLIMVDIDHFKVFNDTFGHQVGDQVLRLVAKTLSEGLTATQFLARYGGEEFSVIVPASKLRDTEKLAERLRERIAAKDIVNQSKNEKLGRLSISLGVAQMHPGEPLTQLIDRADRALYKAKAAGRNQVISIEFDPKLHMVSGDIIIDTNR
jgi:diguanylate cyclase